VNRSTQAIIAHYVEQLDLSGDVLEIGGHSLRQSALDLFPAPRFRYHDLNKKANDIPGTIVADITNCREQIPDDTFDLVVSSAVFEHIDRPWLAAQEIGRILKPGGIAITHTVWSWRNHPCPIDYWRFSPECLEFLFGDLDLLEKGYDLSRRRQNSMGILRDGSDSVPLDQFGGWRENWAVYSVHRKGPGAGVIQFKNSDHPLARYMRADTQGIPTNPKLTGKKPPAVTAGRPASAAAVKTLTRRVIRLEKRISELSARVGALTEPSHPAAGLSRRVGERLKHLVAPKRH
jgi:SAM-dependent methyltransferase